MALATDDHRRMLRGLEGAGFARVQDSSSTSNPLRLTWSTASETRRFRLWVYDITHGGGGSDVRAANEYRIQITNGPQSPDDFDVGGYVDVLLGYSRDSDVIVAYDRRWLQRWSEQLVATNTRGSPSVQVKTEDIQRGYADGFYRLTKTAAFGEADIVTMRTDLLPFYLANIKEVMSGEITANQTTVGATEPGDVVAFCSSHGFSFKADLVARYLASFLAKPFVILAGVSGTGKSKLAELVAQYYSRKIGATTSSTPHLPDSRPSAARTGDEYVFVEQQGEPDPTRFALVAVRPDWIDNQSILGFVNPITQTYESTQALDLLLRANIALQSANEEAPQPRYFLLLDEMNLARVEHYFSDWLACAESRRLSPDGGISQQPVPLHRGSGLTTQITSASGSRQQIEVPASLSLPVNLVVTGTINVDETTFGLSPKVLDRAMVLEFDDVDLDRLAFGEKSGEEHGYRFPNVLPRFQLPSPSDYAALPAAIQQHLKAINGILETARLHFGYRSATEMSRFMIIYRNFLPVRDGLTLADDWLVALDVALLQKVLPRLQGNRAKLENALVGLCLYLRDLRFPEAIADTTEFDRNAAAALPDSYRRALEMLQSLRGFGFVSFFK